KGRLQYFKESATYSAVNVTLLANDAVKPIEVAGWSPLNTGKRALESLINTLQDIADGLIWFAITTLPWLLVIGVPVWIACRLVRRRMRIQPPPPPAMAVGQGQQ